MREELTALEERFWLEGGGSPDFWRTHFADDGHVALPLGIMNREETIAAMALGRPWQRVAMEGLRVVPLTETSVLLTYEASAARLDDEEDYKAVVGSVYVLRDDSWRLAFHQQSPPASPPAV